MYDKVRETTWTLTETYAKSSRSTNQNAPFERLSAHCCQVSKWFRALCHNATAASGVKGDAGSDIVCVLVPAVNPKPETLNPGPEGTLSIGN